MKLVFRILKYLILTFLLIFTALYIRLKIGQIQYKILFDQVDAIAYKEIGKIHLPHELSNQRYTLKTGCNWDFMRNETRCSTEYSLYFATNDNILDEYQEVQNYLYSLGWANSYEPPNITLSQECSN